MVGAAGCNVKTQTIHFSKTIYAWTYSVSQKNNPLRFSDIFSKTVGNF